MKVRIAFRFHKKVWPFKKVNKAVIRHSCSSMKNVNTNLERFHGEICETITLNIYSNNDLAVNWQGQKYLHYVLHKVKSVKMFVHIISLVQTNIHCYF